MLPPQKYFKVIWIVTKGNNDTNLSFCSLADRRSNTGTEKRYQEIVQRRKLVDLAKAQAQEVAVLRAEVERLRMRTFPALVQVEH